MEIILAIVVVGAVIFFGALISAGNERQRKAIDDLREEATLWAMQDLRIKRERLARDVRVDDPLGWLNQIAANACGYDLSLQFVEALDQPRALICTAGDRSTKVVFTPLAPAEIRKMKRMRLGRLSQYAERNPLWSLPSNISTYPISVLNGGMLFDLELALAWKGLTGQTAEKMQCIWMLVMQ